MDSETASVTIETEGNHDGVAVLTSVRVSRVRFANGLRFILDVGDDERTYAFIDDRSGVAKARFVVPHANTAPERRVYIETEGNHDGVVTMTAVDMTLDELREGLAQIGGLF